MSGAKDSTACALLLERHGVEFESVFMDTGWEHPALYDYLDNVLEPRFGKINRLKSAKYPGGMSEMVTLKKGFPSRKMRFCTSYLKVLPFTEFASSLDGDVVNVVGIRREESANRSSAARWGYDTEADCDVFRPLVEHSFDDVIQIDRGGNIEPNPLYLRGASRVGCFPCIYSRKSEIENVAKLYPARIDQIARLESDLSLAAAARFDTDDEWRGKQIHKIVRRVAFLNSLADLGVSWQAFKDFDSGKADLDEGMTAAYREEYDRVMAEKDKDPLYVKEKDRQLARTFFHGRADGGIHEVVEWAKTSRGGVQYRLFDLSARDGCTRWGMCEAALTDSELVKIAESE